MSQKRCFSSGDTRTHLRQVPLRRPRCTNCRPPCPLRSGSSFNGYDDEDKEEGIKDVEGFSWAGDSSGTKALQIVDYKEALMRRSNSTPPSAAAAGNERRTAETFHWILGLVVAVGLGRWLKRATTADSNGRREIWTGSFFVPSLFHFPAANAAEEEKHSHSTLYVLFTFAAPLAAAVAAFAAAARAMGWKRKDVFSVPPRPLLFSAAAWSALVSVVCFAVNIANSQSSGDGSSQVASTPPSSTSAYAAFTLASLFSAAFLVLFLAATQAIRVLQAKEETAEKEKTTSKETATSTATSSKHNSSNSRKLSCITSKLTTNAPPTLASVPPLPKVLLVPLVGWTALAITLAAASVVGKVSAKSQEISPDGARLFQLW